MNMADISGKSPTNRRAVATGKVKMASNTIEALKGNKIPKGDVLGAARIAGIMAAKKTPDIIPLCHPISLSHCSVDFEFESEAVLIRAEATAFGQTGVEMEALVAVSAAALTIYDMCKPLDKMMVITDILLAEKHGGKSGDFVRP
jgi:cyclic pyranopterin phosphate synthase